MMSKEKTYEDKKVREKRKEVEKYAHDQMIITVISVVLVASPPTFLRPLSDGPRLS